jgi:hypothetical protein
MFTNDGWHIYFFGEETGRANAGSLINKYGTLREYERVFL